MLPKVPANARWLLGSPEQANGDEREEHDLDRS